MSSKNPESFDLDRDLPTTPEDVEALRQVAVRSGSAEDYLRFLRALGDGDPPFELP